MTYDDPLLRIAAALESIADSLKPVVVNNIINLPDDIEDRIDS